MCAFAALWNSLYAASSVLSTEKIPLATGRSAGFSVSIGSKTRFRSAVDNPAISAIYGVNPCAYPWTSSGFSSPRV